MELRQLEYFVAVAEEANFTRAAERVHISQSGVSAQIRQLEHDLGATLIDRSGRTATLTTAGTAALGPARAALASAAALRQAVEEVTGLIRGRLAVGMVTACTVTGLFDALAAFHLAHPGIEISLTEDNSDRLVDAVRSGELDLALVGAAGGLPAAVGAFPIVSERLVAAVRADHPLAGQERTTLAELAGYPLVCLPAGTGIRTAFDQGCAAAGRRPTIALQASAPDTVADLAARGLGVAILSESIGAAFADRLHPLLIEDVEIPALLAVIWAGDGPGTGTGSAARRELLAYCRRAFVPRPEPAGAGVRPRQSR